ncbi:MAG: efflux RND transporter periplasmic adaptor subunit [Saprospiraceae bacterium]|nr:efflux RND transporter periplasmic adaptor subunit [Saprospiraceae bacterium]
MNTSTKHIVIGIIALLAGLAGGYFLFSGSDGPQAEASADETAPSTEQVWTCSMHPQIRQNEPGLCPICEMDLIPLAQNTSSDPLVLEMTSEAVKLAQVQTTVGGQQTTASEIRLTGKIQEDERLAASQAVHIPGRIEQLLVTFTGEQVRKGQQLAAVYSPELITAQRELLEALDFQDVNPGIAEAARRKLRYWKISKEAIRDIEENGEIRETFAIYSDVAGYVTRRNVSVGDYVKQGQVIFEIVDYSRLWVLFDAYEEDLARIHVGSRVRFTTPALPDRSFETRITFIDPAIDPQTRVASLRAEVSNTSGILKPEMFVRGTVSTRGRADAQLTVPKSAVLWTGKRSVVYVRLPDTQIPSFQYREVELGDATASGYVVLSGLEAGEEVVTYGNFAIDAAAQLNNQQSMMNKRVSVKGSPTGPPDYADAAPDAFKQQLEKLVEAYLGLKDALVATDPDAAADATGRFIAALGKVDMTLISGDAHLFWMRELEGLKEHAKAIAETDDVELQRRQFGFLSTLLIDTMRSFGTTGQKYFVQYCPMAFDNEGAGWISHEKQIRNPYFGDQMLKCGKVTDTLALHVGVSPAGSQFLHHH